MRFAESKRKDIEALQTATPEAIVTRLSAEAPRNQQQNDIAIGNAKVCLGFGYAEDKPEMSLGSALFLLGLGQTGYAELIGGDFAVGVGLPKNLDRAAAWLDYAAAELDAGRPSAVKGIGSQRAKVLRQVSDQLKLSMQTIPAGLIGPNFGPKFTVTPQAAGQQGQPDADRRSSGAAKYVAVLEDNAVFVFTGESHGTGFFIAPNLILTNDHVVRGYDKVLIVSKMLPLRAQRGKVLYRGKTSGRADDTGLDAAVIEIEGYQHPTALKFAPETPAVGSFVAEGGFPGNALKADRGFQTFLTVFKQGGLPSAEQLPHMTVSTGAVQSYFVDNKTGRERMQQSAQSGHGNSGSPIVNACGQVVALLDSGSALNVEQVKQGDIDAVYAWTFTAAEVTKFLKAVGVKYQTDDEPCRPSDASGTVH
jgi:S1-C subfamily serine protease